MFIPSILFDLYKLAIKFKSIKWEQFSERDSSSQLLDPGVPTPPFHPADTHLPIPSISLSLHTLKLFLHYTILLNVNHGENPPPSSSSPPPPSSSPISSASS